MADVVCLNSKKHFTLQEANKLLPHIFVITDKSNQMLKELLNRHKAVKGHYLEKEKHLDLQIQAVIDDWNTKMTKLGVTPKGVWLVDFDSGSDFYCWKYPETEVCHSHGYKDGYTARAFLGNNHEL